MSKYLSEPQSLEGRAKVELDFSNYGTNVDFKNATAVDASTFSKKRI